MKKPEQLELIDVKDPKYKAVCKQITEYEALKTENQEQHSANMAAEKAKRKKVFEAVEACGIKPDADGVYHVPVDGKIYDISQDAQLKIKKHSAPKDKAPASVSGDDAEGEYAGNEPPLAPRAKK